MNNNSQPKENNKAGIVAIIMMVVLLFTGIFLSTMSTDTTVSVDSNKVYKTNEDIKLSDCTIKVMPMKEATKLDYYGSNPKGKFILIPIEITNTDEYNLFYNTSDFKLKNTNGEMLKPMYLKGGADELLGSGELAPNGKVKGNLLFEVNKKEESLTLNYYKFKLISDSIDINIKIK